ncbi:fatty acid desaturase-domain-containing protein [Phycomyces nitens]|nr:fatty acid desaturase-domain-containing protein [Phycomyces nitens]
MSLKPLVSPKPWPIPDFTIKDIRDAIPPHCLERSTLRSFAYLFQDLFFIFSTAYLASWIDILPSLPLRILLWSVYWVLQSFFGAGLWVLGHECGHQAFSPSKFISDAVGLVIHSSLLVPYYSWKYSHSQHHKSVGHITKDRAHPPPSRSEWGLPPLDDEIDQHSHFDESPIAILYSLAKYVSIGAVYYLLFDVPCDMNKGKWVSHFNPNCYIFTKEQYWNVHLSTAAIVGVISTLMYAGNVYGVLTVFKYYVMPYLLINCWVILVTYLQHTSPNVPRYDSGVWNFQRGAALTIDRSYGPVLDHIFHHVADAHVVHHFISTIPHYHCVEATRHLRTVLGEHYLTDNTPIPRALVDTWMGCKFVEDKGDVRFYKN